ncbi:MAG: ABC transporter ATP-binding protein [Myxococcales bacterium]|nr:ABC transporter ATP-binding protein [Myxococcales bacterium]
MTEPVLEPVLDPVLELVGVTKDFGEDVVTHVLKGIDLRIEAGEFTALVGPSGSGKSTLLNLLGLLDRPTAGSLRVLGRDIAALDDTELTELRGRSIGFVFQFHHLLPALTAAQNVLMPLAIASGRVTPEQRATAIEGLREVGLESRADERTMRLSGGQQQRVAIARALVGRPPLVLADEPTGNLDTTTADEVFELLRGFNRRSKMAFLIVTHSPELAARCDRIVTLVDGRIVEDRRVEH